MGTITLSPDLRAVYATAIHDNIRQYAVWPIGIDVALGDYGRIEDNILIKEGNIRDEPFRLHINKVDCQADIVFEFKSLGIKTAIVDSFISGNLPGNLPVAEGKGRICVSFKSGNSVYFRSIKLTHSTAENFREIGRGVMKAFSEGKWNSKWSVIHGLFTSQGTTALISNGDGAVIELEANVRAGKSVDLADASIGLEVKSEQNIGLRIIAQKKLVPFFSISRIRPRNWWWNMLSFGMEQKEFTSYVTGTVGGAPEVAITGDVILKHDPDMSPELARRLGKPVDDLFQFVEVP